MVDQIEHLMNIRMAEVFHKAVLHRSIRQIISMRYPGYECNLILSFLEENLWWDENFDQPPAAEPAEAPAPFESTIIIENAEAAEEEPEAVHWARFVDDVNNAPEIMALAAPPAEAQ